MHPEGNERHVCDRSTGSDLPEAAHDTPTDLLSEWQRGSSRPVVRCEHGVEPDTHPEPARLMATVVADATRLAALDAADRRAARRGQTVSMTVA